MKKLDECNIIQDPYIKAHIEKESCYSSLDDRIEWLATRAFTREHIGAAISEHEYILRNKLEIQYAEVIGRIKDMISINPDFDKMEFMDKVNYCVNWFYKFLAEYQTKRISKGMK